MDKADKTKQLIRDFQGTFATPEGRRVYEDLKRITKPDVVIKPLDSVGRIDINEVMYNEGKRAVWCYIRAQLEKNPNVVRQTETIKEKEIE